jgi:NAD(P)-dependent dehydrogenase (short-subunit alcohol dehydrogenase family)
LERGSAAGADGTDEPQRAALKSDCLGWLIRLKRLADEVIVITGPTSGIGLATARLAAQRGMRLVLASRNETALARLASEIAGGAGFLAAVGVGSGQPRAPLDGCGGDRGAGNGCRFGRRRRRETLRSVSSLVTPQP